MSKFDFYEIVRIVTENEKYKDINGKLATVKGKAKNEESDEWVYGVIVSGSDEMIRRVYEKDLQYTGMKAIPEPSAGKIKIQVDPDTGEAKIIDE